MIINKVQRAFSLSRDLLKQLQDQDLTLHLGDLRSNSIGEQFWCICGARESYLRGIENNGWSGFSCSLKTSRSVEAILEFFDGTEEILSGLEATTLTEVQTGLLIDLLEHEVQHHGQLIRYFYGNDLTFPISWNDRYTVR